MQVVYHLGAHCTDEDRLLKCLLKNKGDLAEQGIVVAGPGRYRTLLREALLQLRGKPAPQDMQDMILDAVLDTDGADRLVFSNASFISGPANVLDQHMIYSKAGEKTDWLTKVFPDHGCEFHLALCNPALFIPQLFVLSKEKDFNGFLAGVNPMTLRWSDTVHRIRAANPNSKLTVWCNEDTPLIWPEVLAAISGHAAGMQLKGTYDFLASLMTARGITRMGRYLASHPPQTDAQRRRVIAAFMDKFAIPEALEEELDQPGWTAEVIDQLTALYDEDTRRIEQMEGVTFITP